MELHEESIYIKIMIYLTKCDLILSVRLFYQKFSKRKLQSNPRFTILVKSYPDPNNIISVVQ